MTFHAMCYNCIDIDPIRLIQKCVYSNICFLYQYIALLISIRQRENGENVPHNLFSR